MHKEENKVIVQTAKKLGISPTSELISRCSEFLRLLQLKSSIISSTNDISRTVICLDLATQTIKFPYEPDAAQLLKCSGMKKSVYLNTKRMLEKALDLNHKVGINEICLKLGISEVQTAANEILNKYKEFCCGNDDIKDDFSHPQYASVSIFCACKKLKVKVQKQKLITESLLKPQQWNALIKRFEKFLEQDETKTSVEKSSKTQKIEETTKEMQVSVEKGKKRQLPTTDDTEDYEHWKTRILKKAYHDLALLGKLGK